MRRKQNDIASAALELDPRARADLAKRLLESLETLTQHESDALWAEEAERRYVEFKKGAAKAISGRDVFTRARARKR